MRGTQSPPASQPSRRFRGYDATSVAELLGDYDRRLAIALHGIGDHEARLAELEDEHRRRRELDRQLADVLVQAEVEAKRLRESAAAERDRLLREGRDRPADRRVELERERAELTASLRELETVERSVRMRSRSVFEQALRELGGDRGAVRRPAAPTLPEPEPEAPVSAEEAIVAPAAPEVEPDPVVMPEQAPEPGEADTFEDLSSLAALPALIDRSPQPVGGGRRRTGMAALIALAGLGAVGAVAGLLVSGFGGNDPTRAATSQAPPATAATAADTAEPPVTPATSQPVSTEPPTEPSPPEARIAPTTPEAAAPAAGPPVKLLLSASAGDCWLSVRRGSATGKVLFEGFLLRGESRTFTGRKLWVRMGAPTSLTVKLNGSRPRGLPAGTADVLVTRSGVRVLATG